MKNIITIFLFLPIIVFSQSNFEKAEKLFAEKKCDQAQVIFESLYKSNPSDLRVIEYLGDIAGFEESWDKAILYYKKLKIAKPNEANYYFKYGGALGMKATQVNKFKALGMVGEVRSSFEKAIQLDPKHIPARWALIELNLKLPGIVGGSQPKAIQYSNELLKLSPVDGYLSRGHIEEYFDKYANAEKQYLKAYEIGHSKMTFQKLYDLYLNKLKDSSKAKKLKEQFEK